MRIIVIGPVRTAKHFGGVASVTEGLAEGLLRQGQDVLIYTDYSDKDKTEGGVPIRAYGKKPENRTPFISFAMTRGLKALEPDWIITSLHYSKVNRRARRFCRVMTFLHGFPTTSGSLTEFLLIRLFSRSYVKNSDLVVVNSSFAQTVNRDILGIHADGYVSLGIETEALAYFEGCADRSRKKQVLFAGRLVPVKRVDQIIRGFRKSSLPDRGYELVIVGGGRAEGSLRNLAGSDPSITFTGRMDSSALLDRYLDAEIFISLNAHEPFGIVFLEAFAGGAKVVSPSTGGQTDIMRFFPGSSFSCDPYADESVADALNRAAEASLPDRASQMDIVRQKFTYATCAGNILAMINEHQQRK